MIKLTINIFVVLCLMAQNAYASSNAQGIYGYITNYGVVAGKSEPKIIKYDKASPSGERKFYKYKDLKFSKKTDQIPVEKGVRFGLSYKINNVPNSGFLKYKLKVTHPEMKRPDGKVSTEQIYNKKSPIIDGIVYSGNSYVLKYDYELLPGKWSFEYLYENKTLLKQEFVLH